MDLFNPGLLLFRGHAHVICQPLQCFHPVCQLDTGTIFSLLDLADQCAVNVRVFLKPHGIDFLLHVFFFSGFRIFDFYRTKCAHDINSFLSKFYEFGNIGKGNVHVLLEYVVFVHHLPV